MCTWFLCNAVAVVVFFLLFATFTFWSGLIQRCAGYGTLQAPINHDVRVKVSFERAHELCTDSGTGMTVPWSIPAALKCMNQMQGRMQTLYGITTDTKVWWEGDSTAQDERHVICYVRKSCNETLTSTNARSLCFKMNSGECDIIAIQSFSGSPNNSENIARLSIEN